jgi:uncharacterized membrane protein
MNATTAFASRTLSRLWLAVILTALALPASWFIAKSALPYLGFSESHYGPYFWPRRWGLFLHVAGGITALITGVVQLWLGLTNRVATLHRAFGKLYAGAIVVASIAGFYLALTIHGNPPYGSGLFFLCVAWVVTTSMGVITIRRRNLPQHRQWMMRSYAVTFAFVVFRFGVDVLASQGLAIRDAQGVMAWASWAVPLLLLEPLFQLRAAASARTAMSTRAL